MGSFAIVFRPWILFGFFTIFHHSANGQVTPVTSVELNPTLTTQKTADLWKPHQRPNLHPNSQDLHSPHVLPDVHQQQIRPREPNQQHGGQNVNNPYPNQHPGHQYELRSPMPSGSQPPQPPPNDPSRAFNELEYNRMHQSTPHLPLNQPRVESHLQEPLSHHSLPKSQQNQPVPNLPIPRQNEQQALHYRYNQMHPNQPQVAPSHPQDHLQHQPHFSQQGPQYRQNEQPNQPPVQTPNIPDQNNARYQSNQPPMAQGSQPYMAQNETYHPSKTVSYYNQMHHNLPPTQPNMAPPNSQEPSSHQQPPESQPDQHHMDPNSPNARQNEPHYGHNQKHQLRPNQPHMTPSHPQGPIPHQSDSKPHQNQPELNSPQARKNNEPQNPQHGYNQKRPLAHQLPPNELHMAASHPQGPIPHQPDFQAHQNPPGPNSPHSRQTNEPHVPQHEYNQMHPSPHQGLPNQPHMTASHPQGPIPHQRLSESRPHQNQPWPNSPQARQNNEPQVQQHESNQRHPSAHQLPLNQPHMTATHPQGPLPHQPHSKPHQNQTGSSSPQARQNNEPQNLQNGYNKKHQLAHQLPPNESNMAASHPEEPIPRHPASQPYQNKPVQTNEPQAPQQGYNPKYLSPHQGPQNQPHMTASHPQGPIPHQRLSESRPNQNQPWPNPPQARQNNEPQVQTKQSIPQELLDYLRQQQAIKKLPPSIRNYLDGPMGLPNPSSKEISFQQPNTLETPTVKNISEHPNVPVSPPKSLLEKSTSHETLISIKQDKPFQTVGNSEPMNVKETSNQNQSTMPATAQALPEQTNQDFAHPVDAPPRTPVSNSVPDTGHSKSVVGRQINSETAVIKPTVREILTANLRKMIIKRLIAKRLVDPKSIVSVNKTDTSTSRPVSDVSAPGKQLVQPAELQLTENAITSTTILQTTTPIAMVKTDPEQIQIEPNVEPTSTAVKESLEPVVQAGLQDEIGSHPMFGGIDQKTKLLTNHWERLQKNTKKVPVTTQGVYQPPAQSQNLVSQFVTRIGKRLPNLPLSGKPTISKPNAQQTAKTPNGVQSDLIPKLGTPNQMQRVEIPSAANPAKKPGMVRVIYIPGKPGTNQKGFFRVIHVQPQNPATKTPPQQQLNLNNNEKQRHVVPVSPIHKYFNKVTLDNNQYPTPGELRQAITKTNLEAPPLQTVHQKNHTVKTAIGVPVSPSNAANTMKSIETSAKLELKQTIRASSRSASGTNISDRTKNLVDLLKIMKPPGVMEGHKTSNPNKQSIKNHPAQSVGASAARGVTGIKHVNLQQHQHNIITRPNTASTENQTKTSATGQQKTLRVTSLGATPAPISSMDIQKISLSGLVQTKGINAPSSSNANHIPIGTIGTQKINVNGLVQTKGINAPSSSNANYMPISTLETQKINISGLVQTKGINAPSSSNANVFNNLPIKRELHTKDNLKLNTNKNINNHLNIKTPNVFMNRVNRYREFTIQQEKLAFEKQRLEKQKLEKQKSNPFRANFPKAFRNQIQQTSLPQSPTPFPPTPIYTTSYPYTTPVSFRGQNTQGSLYVKSVKIQQEKLALEKQKLTVIQANVSKTQENQIPLAPVLATLTTVSPFLPNIAQKTDTFSPPKPRTAPKTIILSHMPNLALKPNTVSPAKSKLTPKTKLPNLSKPITISPILPYKTQKTKLFSPAQPNKTVIPSVLSMLSGNVNNYAPSINKLTKLSTRPENLLNRLSFNAATVAPSATSKKATRPISGNQLVSVKEQLIQRTVLEILEKQLQLLQGNYLQDIIQKLSLNLNAPTMPLGRTDVNTTPGPTQTVRVSTVNPQIRFGLGQKSIQQKQKVTPAFALKYTTVKPIPVKPQYVFTTYPPPPKIPKPRFPSHFQNRYPVPIFENTIFSTSAPSNNGQYQSHYQRPAYPDHGNKFGLPSHNSGRSSLSEAPTHRVSLPRHYKHGQPNSYEPNTYSDPYGNRGYDQPPPYGEYNQHSGYNMHPAHAVPSKYNPAVQNNHSPVQHENNAPSAYQVGQNPLKRTHNGQHPTSVKQNVHNPQASYHYGQNPQTVQHNGQNPAGNHNGHKQPTVYQNGQNQHAVNHNGQNPQTAHQYQSTAHHKPQPLQHTDHHLSGLQNSPQRDLKIPQHQIPSPSRAMASAVQTPFERTTSPPLVGAPLVDPASEILPPVPEPKQFPLVDPNIGANWHQIGTAPIDPYATAVVTDPHAKSNSAIAVDLHGAASVRINPLGILNTDPLATANTGIAVNQLAALNTPSPVVVVPATPVPTSPPPVATTLFPSELQCYSQADCEVGCCYTLDGEILYEWKVQQNNAPIQPFGYCHVKTTTVIGDTCDPTMCPCSSGEQSCISIPPTNFTMPSGYDPTEQGPISFGKCYSNSQGTQSAMSHMQKAKMMVDMCMMDPSCANLMQPQK